MRRSMIHSLLALALLTLALPAYAQGAITKYTLLVIAPGQNPATAAPVQTTDLAVGVVTCNQTPPPGWPPPLTAAPTNPTTLRWDDPVNAGKLCSAPLAGTLLTALPNAPGYIGVLTATDDIGQVSARSAASNPFTRQGAPAVPTTVRIQ
jgi:hypothetical protein